MSILILLPLAALMLVLMRIALLRRRRVAAGLPARTEWAERLARLGGWVRARWR